MLEDAATEPPHMLVPAGMRALHSAALPRFAHLHFAMKAASKK